MKKWFKGAAATAIAMSAFSLLLNAEGPAYNPGTGFTALASNVEEKLMAGTWFETAHAIWQGSADSDFTVEVRTLGAVDWRNGLLIEDWLTEWETVDAELVRLVDPARNTWRVDIPGLPEGSYEIRVLENGTVKHLFENLETRRFPRYGAAFVPSTEMNFFGPNDLAPVGAVGGYLPDGRVNPEARIVYVTHENMSETLPANIFTANRGPSNARTPLVIRFIGTVGSFDSVSAALADAGVVAPSGIDANRMLRTGNGNGNVTFEGIGPDATIYGWGIGTNGSSNVVIRNLNFDQWFNDAIELHGGGAGQRASQLWVHNNTFHYGQNLHLNLGQDIDNARADGSTDITNHARYYTASFNHYIEGGKVFLVGGGIGSMSAHYGTFHHNWFERTQERTPRIRHGRVHIFNNLYEDIQGHPYHDVLNDRHTGYGIGAGHDATIWAEGNIFEEVNFPFLRSRQGHARGYYPHQGHNHFFGDGAGFIVTEGIEVPSTLAGFRSPTDILGLPSDEEGQRAALLALRETVSRLQPNIMDAATLSDFNSSLDVGIVVDQAGLDVVNPHNGTVGFPAFGGGGDVFAFDNTFRPTALENVWPTQTPEQVAALRQKIETYAGTMSDAAPQAAPIAPTISTIAVNEQFLTPVYRNQHIPEAFPLIHEGTFTVNWNSHDVLAQAYEIQWDQGNGEWATLRELRASARPNRHITQQLNDYGAVIESARWATASIGGTYKFRIRAINEVGASEWSEIYVVGNQDVSPPNLPDYPEWDQATIFDANDRVQWNGRIFEAKWWTQNETPGDSPWGAWMEIGDEAEILGFAVPQWTNSRVFYEGDRVYYDGKLWQSQWWTRNQSPAILHGPWLQVIE